MQQGDKVKFKLAGKDKEGTIFKIFPKTVYIKADFPKQKEKIVIRKVHEITA
jgi:hypothetical protein